MGEDDDQILELADGSASLWSPTGQMATVLVVEIGDAELTVFTTETHILVQASCADGSTLGVLLDGEGLDSLTVDNAAQGTTGVKVDVDVDVEGAELDSRLGPLLGEGHGQWLHRRDREEPGANRRLLTLGPRAAD